MGITFCPSEPVWGDVATWVAAVGTFAAVVTALLTASRAGKVAFAIRADERKEKEAYETSLRQQLAVSFDQELFMAYGNLVNAFVPRLRELQRERNWHAVRDHIINGRPRTGFTLLDRFADRLDVFPIHASSPLLALLGRWHLLREAPDPPLVAPGVDYSAVANSTIAAVEGLAVDMHRARLIVREFAPPDVRMMPIA